MSNPGRFLDEFIERYPDLSVCRDSIEQAYECIAESYEKGGKLLVAGNGGSASDSEHIVGELMKSFILPRKLNAVFCDKLIEADAELGKELGEKLQGALPAIALVDHIALSTAYLNDVDPLLGFAQQINGYGVAGDVFLGITTSGNSKNVLYANTIAKAKGLKTIALSGKDGGKIKCMADITIVVPENETFKIQERHLPIYHCLCLMLEERFFGED
ncbi:MAG: SIS domain-containing protein [Lachnospiraceae bacterium]|jgi:D-sedoheptulose 7-phosphate isomerase|nr:SIS domain-containing protein [Lachnospiraceae bacterium]